MPHGPLAEYGQSKLPVKVLYILGRGRSGSTIFANVLGEMDGFFSAGELRFLWDPIVSKTVPCACGKPVTECEVWSAVLSELGDIDPAHAADLQRAIVKERNFWRLLRYPLDGSWAALDEYALITKRVYETLSSVTGCRVIVDSSKRPSFAALVRLIDGITLHIVHVVRDPRASAYSWRHQRHQSVRGENIEVTRRNVLDATVRWNVLNIEAEIMMRRMAEGRVTSLRYEDFVAAPRPTVVEITRFVAEDAAPSQFLDERTVELGPNHTLGGNPSRFATGRIVVRDSREWLIEQSSWDRWLATAIASPFLRRYRYPARLGARGSRS